MTIQPISLDEIVAAALSDAKAPADLDLQALQQLPTRFPVQVDQQTRVFLECHAMALNMSIASLSGLILNKVVEATLARERQRPDLG